MPHRFVARIRTFRNAGGAVTRGLGISCPPRRSARSPSPSRWPWAASRGSCRPDLGVARCTSPRRPRRQQGGAWASPDEPRSGAQAVGALDRAPPDQPPRRRCGPRCPRHTDATWMGASGGAASSARPTAPDDSDGLGAPDDSDPSVGPGSRQPAPPPQDARAAASSASLSAPLIVHPPRGRHCLCTINAAPPVRVSDYLRWMQAAERGRPARWPRSLAARCPTAAEGWDPSWRLRVAEVGEFTVASPQLRC